MLRAGAEPAKPATRVQLLGDAEPVLHRADLGRQCVTRDRAYALFAERAEAERQHREARERHHAELAELAAENRPGVDLRSQV
jgi:hypothetical protein